MTFVKSFLGKRFIPVEFNIDSQVPLAKDSKLSGLSAQEIVFQKPPGGPSGQLDLGF